MSFVNFQRYLQQKPPSGCRVDWRHPLTRGLSQCWLCLEGQGRTLADLAASGNNCVITSGSWLSGAVQYNGTSTYSTPRTSIGFTGQFTLSLWYITSDATSTARMLAGHSDGSRKLGKAVTANKAFVRIIAGGSSDNTVSLPPANHWHHVILRRDSLNKVDLILDAGSPSRLFSDAAQSGTAGFEWFGRSDNTNGQYWLGSIDRIGAYARALSATEIRSLFESPYQFILWPEPPVSYFFGGIAHQLSARAAAFGQARMPASLAKPLAAKSAGAGLARLQSALAKPLSARSQGQGAARQNARLAKSLAARAQGQSFARSLVIKAVVIHSLSARAAGQGNTRTRLRTRRYDYPAGTENIGLAELDGCIVFPHLPNWKDPVRIKRAWATSIASGIAGGEDRASERTAPTRKLTYTITADGIQEGEVLSERLKAALESGRAVCPLWGRAQGVRPALGDLEVTWGQWPWAAGDYAFLCLPSKMQNLGINQRFQIDAAGLYDTGDWEPDTNYSPSYPHRHETTTPIDVTHLGGVTPPTQAVLQSFAYGAGLGTLSWTVKVAQPARCKVRLWFAFVDGEMWWPGKTGIIRANITGAPEQQINPWTACGSVYNQAGFVDLAAYPGSDGLITIRLDLTTGLWLQLNAFEVFSTCWQIVPVQAVEGADPKTLVFNPAHLTFPDFTEIVQIYPVIFGRLSAGDIEALTSRVGAVEISIQEPLGAAVAGRVGACQTEICGLATEPEPEITEWTGAALEGDCGINGYPLVWNETYAWKPWLELSAAWIAYHKAWMRAWQDDYRAWNPGTTFGPSYWYFNNTAGPVINAAVYAAILDQGRTDVPTEGYNSGGYWVMTCAVIPPP